MKMNEKRLMMYNQILNNENFVIIIDFKDCNILNNISNANFKLSILDGNEGVINTAYNTINNISIFKDNTSSVDMRSNYLNEVLNYNADSLTSIQLQNLINYGTSDEQSIINTEYEEKKLGLLFKFVDSNNNDVSKEYLNNMYISIDNHNYYFDSSNSIKINYGRLTTITNKTLSLVTRENSNSLQPGIYYLKLSSFITKNNIDYLSKNTTEISIPVLISYNGNNIDYTFTVTGEDLNVNKSLNSKTITFNVTLLGVLTDPIIKVSLYEKRSLTAYNQTYDLVNLSSFVSDTLTSTSNNTYYVGSGTTTFNLHLINNRFGNNGYKYLFELYDGNMKIGELEKYFIAN